MERWFLTAHERTAITTATKEVCGICNSDSKPAHKEAGLSRDEEDVKKLITTVPSVMSNPFDMESVNDGVTVPLSNLETGRDATRYRYSSPQCREAWNARDYFLYYEENYQQQNGVLGYTPQTEDQNLCKHGKEGASKAFRRETCDCEFRQKSFCPSFDSFKVKGHYLWDLLKYELSPVPWALAHKEKTPKKLSAKHA